MESQEMDRWSVRLGIAGMVVLLLVFAELLGLLMISNKTALIFVDLLLFAALVVHWRLQLRAFSGQVRRRYFLYVFPIAGRVLALVLMSFAGAFGVLLGIGLFVAADALLLAGLIRMAPELTKESTPS